MKRVIVTGAAGLVGMSLVPMLVKQKYKVIAIDRSENIKLLGRLNPKAKCLQIDISESGKWQDEFKGADIVITLHAQIAAMSLKPFVKSNVDAVKLVLASCKKYKIKNLIHLSSSVVISAAKDEYTETKRKGEKIVKESKIPHTILRPPLMFGLFDSKHLGWITRFMQKFPIVPLPGSGRYMRQPLFATDLCKVIVELTKRKPKNKIWNIIGREKITYVDLLKIIARTRGWKRIFIPVPLPIFGFALKIYGFITGKPMFTPKQMKALIAGDEFPIEPWCEEFNVPYTPFRQAIWQTWNSKYSKYAKEMKSPH